MTQYIPYLSLLGTILTVLYYHFRQKYETRNVFEDGFVKGMNAWFSVNRFSDEELHDLSIKETELLVYCPEYKCHRIAIYNHAYHRFEDKLTGIAIQDVKRFRLVSTAKVVFVDHKISKK
mgnify:CR=1 FL=1